MSFDILKKEASYFLNKIPVSTITLPEWRCQAFYHESLFESLTWTFKVSSGKSYICISYKIKTPWAGEDGKLQLKRNVYDVEI